MPVGTIGSRTWVGVAVTGGPMAMLLVMAGALPPTAETLMLAALAVTARTVRARMLLVVTAG